LPQLAVHRLGSGSAAAWQQYWRYRITAAVLIVTPVIQVTLTYKALAPALFIPVVYWEVVAVQRAVSVDTSIQMAAIIIQWYRVLVV
jgi:hypothetical protein